MAPGSATPAVGWVCSAYLKGAHPGGCGEITDTKRYFTKRPTDNNSAYLILAAPRRDAVGKRRVSSGHGDIWVCKKPPGTGRDRQGTTNEHKWTRRGNRRWYRFFKGWDATPTGSWGYGGGCFPCGSLFSVRDRGHSLPGFVPICLHDGFPVPGGHTPRRGECA